jgi:Flp pilus assembly CpaE family ATPase
MARTGVTYNVARRALERSEQQVPLSPTEVTTEVTGSTGRVVTVVSHNGGSGRSTAAVLLASQIARSSRAAGKSLRVCLVDLDTQHGNVGSLIGTYTPTALNLRVAPVWDARTVAESMVHDPMLGISALLAPIRVRPADGVGLAFYREVLGVLRASFDVIVLDAPGQDSEMTASLALPEADSIVFVTDMSIISVHGMARSLREMTDPIADGGLGVDRSKIGVLVNQSVEGVGMEQARLLEAALGSPILGQIPLATKDTFLAMNQAQIGRLLVHPLLGPAYLRVARVCVPDARLAPLVEAEAQ